MSDYKKRLGKEGEQQAAAYLERHAYRLLAQNYRCRWGEIDLIAEKSGELHFIEVKTRRNLDYGTPAEAVTREKQRRIGWVAADYMHREVKEYTGFHMDVIEIMLEEEKFHIRHLKDAIGK